MKEFPLHFFLESESPTHPEHERLQRPQVLTYTKLPYFLLARNHAIRSTRNFTAYM